MLFYSNIKAEHEDPWANEGWDEAAAAKRDEEWRSFGAGFDVFLYESQVRCVLSRVWRAKGPCVVKNVNSLTRPYPLADTRARSGVPLSRERVRRFSQENGAHIYMAACVGRRAEMIEHFKESFERHFNDTAMSEDGQPPRALYSTTTAPRFWGGLPEKEIYIPMLILFQFFGVSLLSLSLSLSDQHFAGSCRTLRSSRSSPRLRTS